MNTGAAFEGLEMGQTLLEREDVLESAGLGAGLQIARLRIAHRFSRKISPAAAYLQGLLGSVNKNGWQHLCWGHARWGAAVAGGIPVGR